MRLRDTGPWLLALLIAVALLLPTPIQIQHSRWPALLRELQDLGHPLAFGLLAHLTLCRLRARNVGRPPEPYLLVLIGTAAFGLVTEAAQSMTGRDPSWADVCNDLLGAGIAMLLHAREEVTSKVTRHALALASGSLALLAATPLVVTIGAYIYRDATQPVLWRDGSALLNRFSHWQQGRYPGLVLDEPTPDWQSWHFLEVDIENLRSVSSTVVVRVHDRTHSHDFRDRYNEAFLLPAGSRQTLRIPLERIKDAPESRAMDLTAIRGVILFSPGGDTAGSFLVHEIRLARQVGPQALVPPRPYLSSNLTISSSPR